MAKLTSLFTPHGNLGPVCFFERGGKAFVRMAPAKGGRRWHHHPRLERSRENALEFGGASKAAAALHRQIPKEMLPLCHPYAHNTLAGALRTASRAARKRLREAYPGNAHGSPFARQRPLPAFAAAATAPALEGLGLGHTRGPDSPLVSSHGGVYSIHGLRERALRIRQTPQPARRKSKGPRPPEGRLEYRVHIAFVHIGDLHRDPHASARRPGYHFPHHPVRLPQPSPSGWISPAWSPNSSPDDPTFDHDPDRLDLPRVTVPPGLLAKAREGAILVLLGIEWRERTGRRVKHLRAMSTLSIVEAIPVEGREAAAPRPRRPHNTRHTTRHRQPAHPRPPVMPGPAERLAQALKPLVPPG